MRVDEVTAEGNNTTEGPRIAFLSDNDTEEMTGIECRIRAFWNIYEKTCSHFKFERKKKVGNYELLEWQ